MPRRSSEVTKAIGASAAKLLRDLADVVERGEFYDLEIQGLSQQYVLFAEPIRRQYIIRVVTVEEVGRG